GMAFAGPRASDHPMRSDITRSVSPEGPGPPINNGKRPSRCQWPGGVRVAGPTDSTATFARNVSASRSRFIKRLHRAGNLGYQVKLTQISSMPENHSHGIRLIGVTIRK